MDYDITKEIAYFNSYSSIDTPKDSSHIYSRYGWFDGKKETVKIWDNSCIINKTQAIQSDSINYSLKSEEGNSYSNTIITDTLEKSILFGDFAYVNNKIDSVVITDHSYLIKIDKQDSLFLRADTLVTYKSKDKNSVVLGYKNTRFFKGKLSGLCDSLVIENIDSTLYMFTKPIVWQDKQQLTGNHINIQFKDKQPDSAFVFGDSFIISVDTTDTYHNQAKGENMEVSFNEGKINKVRILKKGEAIYFPIDEKDNSAIGMNHINCEDMIIYFKENDLHHITFLSQPKALLTPLNTQNIHQKLDGYLYQYKIRPTSIQNLHSIQ